MGSALPSVRRASFRRAGRLLERHGTELRDPVIALASTSRDPEVRFAARRVLEGLLPDLDPPPRANAVFGFGRLSPLAVADALEQLEARPALLLRNLAGAAALAIEQPRELETVLREALLSNDDRRRSRAVAFTRLLRLRALVPELRTVLRRGGAGSAVAASALGVLRDDDALVILGEASRSADPALARAATRALAACRSRNE
jgi:hypothetical protein